MSWQSVLLGRPIVVIATVGLTVLSFVQSQDRPWFLIILIAAFIVVHESVNWLRDKRAAVELGPNYQVIQGRVLRLIADLADLTAGGFDLWMIDLYLTSQTAGVLGRFWNGANLTRSLSVALTDVRSVPLEIEMDHELFGVCFSQSSRALWWDTDLADPSPGNAWHRTSPSTNSELSSTYGVISVNPVVDHLGRNCRGLLVVHAKRDSVVVRKVVGALREGEGQRRLEAACQDIHFQVTSEGRADG